MRRVVPYVALVVVSLGGVYLSARQSPAPMSVSVTPLPGETHLRNIRQLTFGGENAEAYFSFDGKRLIFQSTRQGVDCDQIFTMAVDGSQQRRVSNGQGRTTCSYFSPAGDSIVYASTYLGGTACPAKPDFSRGYVWPIYHSYDIFRARPDGSGIERLTDTPGYDAEATVGPDGRIIFTSVRDGDMELYVMDADGKNVKRITNRPGPDGGAFFSKDGKMIVWRGKTLTDPKELDEYRALLKEGLWRPSDLEIMVANADGTNIRTVTALPGASFAPYFTPDSKKIIFSSNHLDPRGRNFDLFLVNVDGSGIERVTTNESFDGFPMFSPDGRSITCSTTPTAGSPSTPTL